MWGGKSGGNDQEQRGPSPSLLTLWNNPYFPHTPKLGGSSVKSADIGLLNYLNAWELEPDIISLRKMRNGICVNNGESGTHS